MRYYLTSDLHGVNVELLKEKLNKIGFIEGDENHILCVVGDIIDGMRNEDTLIPYLRMLERNNQLLAVKGNHDARTEKDIVGQHLNHMTITDEDYEWLQALPYQIETEHFILAHGIYVSEEDKKTLKQPNNLIINGSPILLNAPSINDWWNLEIYDIVNFKSRYKNVREYIDSLPKKLFVGHFNRESVEEYDLENNFSIDQYGTFNCDNKLIYLDSGLLNIAKFNSLTSDDINIHIVEV